jgi:cell division transport system permease protein
VMYYLNKVIPEIQIWNDELLLGILFGTILTVGIVITLISTLFATQRFLNLRTEDLYY